MPTYENNLYYDGVWTRWMSTGTSTTLTTTNTVWGNWNATASTTTFQTYDFIDATAFGETNRSYLVRPARPVVPVMSDAEIRKAALAAQRLLKRQAREREVATAKARRLLLANLTPEQRDEFERLERFHVIAADGRTYRVNRGWSGNLQLIQDEFITEQLCVHPNVATPIEDSMLAQKLMLETDPAQLRRIANITRLHRRLEDAA
jgi:hypothetical protein